MSQHLNKSIAPDFAQLRQDYDEFIARDAEVLVIGPDGPRAFIRTWQTEGFPFPGLADPQHTVG
jgi:peroxiredoxin